MLRFTLFVIIESYKSLWEVEDEVIQVSFYKACLGLGKSKIFKQMDEGWGKGHSTEKEKCYLETLDKISEEIHKSWKLVLEYVAKSSRYQRKIIQLAGSYNIGSQS